MAKATRRTSSFPLALPDLSCPFAHVNPDVHSKGIGQAAWKAVEQMHPEIKLWETVTPYFEKRNIHFYVNRCGFHIVEFWNKHFHGPAIPEEEEGRWSEDDEMFLFRKVIWN